MAWTYDLYPHAQGSHVRKPMIECTGEKILKEYCYHSGLIGQFEEIRRRTRARLTTIPYITSFFIPRRAGDRPEVIPDGCVSLGLLGQFVEMPGGCVFTAEESARTATMTIYGLLNLDRDVPPIWSAQYDVRAPLTAAKTMDGNGLPGEKVLNRFLRGTYYKDILPRSGWAGRLSGTTVKGSL